ncbi:protein of unknown function (plasmid) [Azospirillum lipoferum 4B]|uniref:Uncharacterized protein n=1 Tax=Azospirillum lipoferum (strain 4B) TaxID=862719 RepID=G7ZFB4_AZOL4|nr:protein of unknown function [Azospirillum lipoferum 4B]
MVNCKYVIFNFCFERMLLYLIDCASSYADLDPPGAYEKGCHAWAQGGTDAGTKHSTMGRSTGAGPAPLGRWRHEVRCRLRSLRCGSSRLRAAERRCMFSQMLFSQMLYGGRRRPVATARGENPVR